MRVTLSRLRTALKIFWCVMRGGSVGYRLRFMNGEVHFEAPRTRVLMIDCRYANTLLVDQEVSPWN